MNDRLSLFTYVNVQGGGELPGSVILKTPPRSIMATGSEHAVSPRNTPF